MMPEPQDHNDDCCYIPLENHGYDLIFTEMGDGRMQLQFRDVPASKITYCLMSSRSVYKLRKFLDGVALPVALEETDYVAGRHDRGEEVMPDDPDG